MYATTSESNICSCFSSQLLASNFSSLLIPARWFSTWIALGDVDLSFSLILVRKANAVDEETTWSTWLYHQHNTHVTHGMTVTSFSASFLQKTSVATNHLYQIMLNQKSLHKFKKWCKFSRCINLYATRFKWLQSTFTYDIIFAWHLNFSTWFTKNFIISGTKKDLIVD